MGVVVQVVSVIGAFLILLAYAAVQRNWWRPDQALYLWANLLGASLLAVVAIIDQRIGFVVLEVVWAGISLWGLIRRRPVRSAQASP